MGRIHTRGSSLRFDNLKFELPDLRKSLPSQDSFKIDDISIDGKLSDLKTEIIKVASPTEIGEQRKWLTKENTQGLKQSI